MKANAIVDWLNERDPLNEWSVDDDVFCLHCDGVFKVQDVARDYGSYPTCPVCRNSTPIDFHGIPWWREDLVDESDDGEGIVRQWRGEPIHGIAGKPGRLPARGGE